MPVGKRCTNRRRLRPLIAACGGLVFSLLPSFAACQTSSILAEDILSVRISSVLAQEGYSAASVHELLAAFAGRAKFDFPVRPGDQLILRLDPATKRVLAASLTDPDSSISYHRFQTSDGQSEFFDPRGRSAARSLRRRPFDGMMQVQARFGVRPADMRMQTGVVWEAAFGTAVIAPGSGIIRTVEFYDEGARISIDHGNGYQTTYSPLTNFDRLPGTVVVEGDVLGRVGSSGAEKAGLFYEIIVNGRANDPLRTLLPAARTLEGETLASFQRERGHIDAMPYIAYGLFKPR